MPREPRLSTGFLGALALGVLLLAWMAWSAPAENGEVAVQDDGLAELLDELVRCRQVGDAARPSSRPDCTGVVYVWSESMPLSRRGIREISSAAGQLGVRLALLDAAELEALAAELFPSGVLAARTPALRSPEDELVAELLAAGATLHHPSLLVVENGRLRGPALLGYKTADAYRALVAERLGRLGALGGEAPTASATTGYSVAALPPQAPLERMLALRLAWSRDFPVQGRPGPYFRSVPGRQTLAFEAGRTVYLLDLTTGGTSVAAGTIDFVPTPDGRMFVTPEDRRRGLAFYDAEEVFDAAQRGDGRSLEPVYLDREMRDQYPSVGILSGSAEASGRVVYRVLTSWFDRIVYRDYEVFPAGGRGRLTVRPLADPVVACPRVSTPIMAPDGRELAGRDESSATTQIFRLGGTGCEAVTDIGLPTGKVAWAPDGRALAFAVPRGAVRDGSRTLWIGQDDPSLAGIFVYHRDGARLEHVEGSARAQRLAFPEFVGGDSLAFVLTPLSARDQSVFRLVCCVR